MFAAVTGATGLVGANVVRMLLSRGDSVRVLWRPSADLRPLAGLDVDRVEGDILDPASPRRLLQGASHLFHCAGLVRIGWTRREEQWQVNVEGTRHVAAAAWEQGAKLVHVSSVDALGWGTIDSPADEETPLRVDLPPIPYVESKRAAEGVVQEFVARGADAVIVNPAYMLGPWDWKPSSGRMLLQVARGSAWLAPPGGNDFCDVRDVAQGILAAGEKGVPGRKYILGGHPLSYLDAWRMFAKLTGGRAPIAAARRRQVLLAGYLGGAWGRLRGSEGDLNSASAWISTQPHHFSYARAARELGYRVRPLAETIQDAWEWFQSQGFDGRSPRK